MVTFIQTLRLSSYSLNSFSAGSVTNLLSNDAGQIEVNLWSFNFLWVSPIKLHLKFTIVFVYLAHIYRYFDYQFVFLAFCEIYHIDCCILHNSTSIVLYYLWSSLCMSPVGRFCLVEKHFDVLNVQNESTTKDG